MAKKVSSSQAKANLSALVAEVAFAGQHIIIERRGKALAALVSIEDLERLEQGITDDSHPHGALALVGAWRELDDSELDSLVSDIYAERAKDTGRSVELGD